MSVSATTSNHTRLRITITERKSTTLLSKGASLNLFLHFPGPVGLRNQWLFLPVSILPGVLPPFGKPLPFSTPGITPFPGPLTHRIAPPSNLRNLLECNAPWGADIMATHVVPCGHRHQASVIHMPSYGPWRSTPAALARLDLVPPSAIGRACRRRTAQCTKRMADLASLVFERAKEARRTHATAPHLSDGPGICPHKTPMAQKGRLSRQGSHYPPARHHHPRRHKSYRRHHHH